MNGVEATRQAKPGGGKTKQGRKPTPDFIKNSITPFDFYSHELPNAPLKKHDWNDGGLCPFHADNTPGSFRVNLTTGAFKCFACGSAGSDVIAFIMTLYGLDFVEALTKLSDDWGLL